MARYDRTIPPGGEGKITLEVKTKSYQGNVHKSARVFTNDPKHAQMTIGLKGKVWVPVRVSPHVVHLRGVEGEPVERLVSLEAQKKDPLEVKVASVSIPDKIDVAVKEVQKGRKFQVTVKNKVTTAANYNGSIKLSTNYPDKPEITVRVSANLRPVLEVRPKIINFGRMSQKRLEELKKRSFGVRPVTVVLNRGEGLHIDKVEVEKGLFKATSKDIRPGRVEQVLVEPVFENLKQGKNRDHLKIYTNQKSRPVIDVDVTFEIL